MSRFFQETPSFYSEKDDKIPCFIEKALVSLKKASDLEQLRKKDPLFYFFYVFLKENYYETIFQARFPDIFRPDTANLHYLLNEKYKEIDEKYRVEIKDFHCFFVKMDQMFEASFSSFLMYFHNKKKKPKYMKNFHQKVEIKHLDLSDYVVKTKEKTGNFVGFVFLDFLRFSLSII